MKTVLFIPIFFLISLVGRAQQVALHGIVAVFNSKFETGKIEYVANAAVNEELERAQGTLTQADGAFKLVLVGVRPRSSFNFTIKKEQYEVVNADQLRAVAGQVEAVRIFMAPKGKIAENKRKYYHIGKTASEETLNAKIKDKQQDLAELRKDLNNNSLKIKNLEKEVADLYQRYETIDQSARQLAEQFSRVNLDDASELYQRAFRQFQNGHIDSALMVLDELNWAARVDSILTEEARLFALKNLIQYNDSVITRQQDSIAAALRIKVQSHLGLRQYREALRSTEWLIGLYRDSTQRADAYREAAWLALVAQEYPLAKLYAQSGLELAPKSPVLWRYLAYSTGLQQDTNGSQVALQTARRYTAVGENVNELLRRDIQWLEQQGLPATDIALLRKLVGD